MTSLDLTGGAAVITALAGLVAALTALVIQLRGLRSDMVDAVNTHKNETIAAIRCAAGNTPTINTEIQPKG